MQFSVICSFLTLAVSKLVCGQDTASPPKDYYYPQPPLPDTKAIRDPASWTLDPSFEITNIPVSGLYPLPASMVQNLEKSTDDRPPENTTGLWLPSQRLRMDILVKYMQLTTSFLAH
jgi:hypothetical protein